MVIMLFSLLTHDTCPESQWSVCLPPGELPPQPDASLTGCETGVSVLPHTGAGCLPRVIRPALCTSLLCKTIITE